MFTNQLSEDDSKGVKKGNLKRERMREEGRLSSAKKRKLDDRSEGRSSFFLPESILEPISQERIPSPEPLEKSPNNLNPPQREESGGGKSDAHFTPVRRGFSQGEEIIEDNASSSYSTPVSRGRYFHRFGDGTNRTDLDGTPLSWQTEGRLSPPSTPVKVRRSGNDSNLDTGERAKRAQERVNRRNALSSVRRKLF